MGNYPIESIIGYGLIISLVTVIVRIILVFAGAHWQDPFGRKKKSIDGTDNSTEKDDTWKNVLVVAWTGTRGVISLAAAMALPLVLLDGTVFPKRFSIIFIAFIVIFVTLVVQGLSLPLLIRWLHIKSDDDTEEVEKELQLMLANSTLQFIEKEFPVQGDDKLQQQLKIQYAQQSLKLAKELSIYKKVKYLNHSIQPQLPDNHLLAQIEINKFQRHLLLKLHQDGEFSDTAIRNIERGMDIDDLKINQQVQKED